MRLILGITGATGALLGIRCLQALSANPEVETHLIVSRWGRLTIKHETGRSWTEYAALASVVHQPEDMAATISSGSFLTDGMIIAPCSMKTLAGIRAGFADGLIGRAADVTIKEHRPLVLVPRETPLSEIHLDNMLALARMGVRIVPPMPAFYNLSQTVEEIVGHTVARILDQFALDYPGAKRWAGLQRAQSLADTDGPSGDD